MTGAPAAERLTDKIVRWSAALLTAGVVAVLLVAMAASVFDVWREIQ